MSHVDILESLRLDDFNLVTAEQTTETEMPLCASFRHPLNHKQCVHVGHNSPYTYLTYICFITDLFHQQLTQSSIHYDMLAVCMNLLFLVVVK